MQRIDDRARRALGYAPILVVGLLLVWLVYFPIERFVLSRFQGIKELGSGVMMVTAAVRQVRPPLSGRDS